MKKLILISLFLVSCVTIRIGMDDPDSQINIGFFDIDWWIKCTINSPIEYEYKNLELKPDAFKVNWDKTIYYGKCNGSSR